MSKKRILLIDDHPEENSNYVSGLSMEYDVDTTAYVSTARIKLKTDPSRYNLIVLDIMMPAQGHDFNGKDTDDGLRTGLAYYEAELKDLNIPVLFWSWNEGFKDDVNKEWLNTDFLHKDLDDDHLLKGVEAFWKKIVK